MFTIKVTLEDGRIIESPPLDLNPGEDIYEIADDLASRHNGEKRFLHIDGGSAIQKLIPIGKIVSIDVLSVGEMDTSVRTTKGKLSLVEKTP